MLLFLAPEQWVRKEQQASILHHKQALTSGKQTISSDYTL